MSGHVGTRRADVRPCGTPAAYRRHKRRGEPIDESCRQAEALRHAVYVERTGYGELRQRRYREARAAGMSKSDALRARTVNRELAGRQP